jgi:hypothetical protein
MYNFFKNQQFYNNHQGDDMAQLISGLVLKDQDTKSRRQQKNFLMKCFFVSMILNHCFVSINNPELTLISVLMKAQHVKVYFNVGHSLGSVVTVNSNTT